MNIFVLVPNVYMNHANLGHIKPWFTDESLINGKPIPIQIDARSNCRVSGLDDHLNPDSSNPKTSITCK